MESSQSNKQLIKELERLRIAQEAANLGIWDWDIQEESLEWTEQIYKIFDIPKTSFGASYAAFLEAVHPEDRKLVEDAVNASLADPKFPYQVEHRLVTKSEEVRWVLETGKVFFDKDNKPMRMIGVVQDISSRVAKEKKIDQQASLLKLRTKLQAIGKLSGDLSHEILTPLTIMKSIVDSLRHNLADRGELSNSQSTAYFDRFDQTMERTLAIIASMKLLLHDASNAPFASVPIKKIIDEVIPLIEHKLDAKQITLNITYENNTNSAIIQCREVQVIQALINLIQNAYDSIETSFSAKKEVNIRIEQSQPYINISVEDSGAVVPHELEDLIMDEFFSTKPAGKGTGLGLSISNQIMEEHGGKLSYESKPKKAFVLSFKN